MYNLVTDVLIPLILTYFVVIITTTVIVVKKLVPKTPPPDLNYFELMPQNSPKVLTEELEKSKELKLWE
jgi:hypothetical protein